MKRALSVLLAMIAFGYVLQTTSVALAQLDVQSKEVLSIPSVSTGEPAAGKRVSVTPPEYAGTNVFHTVFLPEKWNKDGEALPIIFEYTGNYYPKTGSTGEPEDAGLGYGLSGGKYIWVSLPFVSKDGSDNAVTWWGDEQATVAYAKQNVPRIINEFGADPQAVFLCGFSRGAIGVNYIGLHDDQISQLWTAFISHDHFDGANEWRGTTWGSPLDKYRTEALQRLKRVGNRPYLVSQNGNKRDTEQYIRSVLSDVGNFTFGYVNTGEILGKFPNEYAKAGHTDRWPLKPSEYRTTTWKWMNRVANSETGDPWIELIGEEGPTGIAEIGENLTVCADVQLDSNPKNLTAVPGAGVVAALTKLKVGKGNNLLSEEEFGDCEVQLEFLIAKGCNSGVKLQHRYEIQLFDSHDTAKPTAKECGGIYPHWVPQGKGKGLKYIDEGVPPKVNAAKPAGEWQTLKIIFKAPRFDSEGKKTKNVRFVSVTLNGQSIHQDVEVDSPTGNASTPLPEVTEAPLFLQLDHGAVAFRNVRIRPLTLQK